MDVLTDEAHQEITGKHDTTGHKSSTLKQVMIEVEKMIKREKDRKASWEDRQSKDCSSWRRNNPVHPITRSPRISGNQA